MQVPADRLGKYELVRHLASGGMARVYLARVSGVGGFERHVVLKTVRPERGEDESYVAMFLDEARLVATLHHQHVAQVYEIGVADDGTYFLAMEYLHGETVRAVLERARLKGLRLPLDFGLTAVCAAAGGLHHAHQRRNSDGQLLGIVHRDVSPSNVICGYDGAVKIIDFGIAKAETRTTRTQTGFVKGKAGYMAPEQALGYPVDARSDVFALGVVLYELTTQVRAFRAATEYEAVQRIVRGEVTPPSQVADNYPTELEDVVLTALQVDPDDRFSDADAMRRAIEMTAQHLGITLGAGPITRVLHDLFGARAEPWLEARMRDDGPTEVLSESSPMIGVAARAPRFARGSTNQGEPPMRPSQTPEVDENPTHRFITMDGEISQPGTAMPLPPPDLGVAPAVPLRTTAPLPALPPLPVPPPVPPSLRASQPTLTRLPPPPGPPPPVPPPLVVPPPLPLVARPTPTRLPQPPRDPQMATRPVASLLDSLPPLPPGATQPIVMPRPRPTARGTEPSLDAVVLTWSRERIVRIAGAVTAAIVAVGIVAMIARGDDDAAAPSAAALSTLAPNPAPAPAPALPAKPTPRPDAKSQPPPSDDAPAGPSSGVVSVRVVTDPPGATVLLDNVRLGTSPLLISVPASDEVRTLKVRKRRHVPKKTELVLDHDVTWSIRLPRRRR